MRWSKMFVAGSLVMLLGAGCVSSRSGRVYSRDDARQVHTVDLGVVEAVNRYAVQGGDQVSGFQLCEISRGMWGDLIDAKPFLDPGDRKINLVETLKRSDQ